MVVQICKAEDGFDEGGRVQAEPVCGACMPQYVRCLQCLQTAQDELHEAEAQLGAAAEMSDLCAEREATLVQARHNPPPPFCVSRVAVREAGCSRGIA